jgi:hypothetical protein
VLGELEAAEAAHRAMTAAAAREERALAHDMFIRAFRSPRARYTFRSPYTGRLVRTE